MRRKQHFMTITFPMAHHYCIVDATVHGQEIFKMMIHFPNHGRDDVARVAVRLNVCAECPCGGLCHISLLPAVAAPRGAAHLIS